MVDYLLVSIGTIDGREIDGDFIITMAKLKDALSKFPDCDSLGRDLIVRVGWADSEVTRNEIEFLRVCKQQTEVEYLAEEALTAGYRVIGKDEFAAGSN
jgi:hypothetical protein